MTEFKSISPLCRRVLANLPADAANSLTHLQLAMMEGAIESGERRNYPVDIRLSVPLFWRRYHFVLLAGPERRSAERRALDRAKRLLWRFGNCVVFALFLLLLIPAVIGAIRIISS